VSEYNSFLDPWENILQDKDSEKKWNFSLVRTLKESGKLLEGYKVYATKSVKPAANDLKGKA